MDAFKKKAAGTNVPHNPTTKIKDMCKGFILTDNNIKQIMQKFLEEVNKGLRKATHNAAKVKCYNTYIQNLPSGNEQGEFLALVFESVHVRVLYINIKMDSIESDSNTYEIASNIKYGGNGSELFDFLAQCVVDFCEEREVSYSKIYLAFTFGFPIKQIAVDAGLLQWWGKGFQCTNTIGKDMVQMLKDALVRKKAPGVEVVAIINDTTGTLMACAWKNPTCKIGLIIADGYNICYVERITHVELFNASRKKRNVIVNTECGAFGDSGELEAYRTEFDRELDRNSSSPSVMTAEKMISGLYLGEIVRLVILKSASKKLLFGGNLAAHRIQQNHVQAKHVSDICSDAEGVFTNCTRVLEQLGLSQVTEQDMVDVHYICECVLTRAAYLVTAQLTTLVNKMNQENVSIGVEGYVYQDSEIFRNLIAGKMKQLLPPNITVDFTTTDDGSGKGAALVAAAAVEGRKRSKTVIV